PAGVRARGPARDTRRGVPAGAGGRRVSAHARQREHGENRPRLALAGVAPRSARSRAYRGLRRRRGAGQEDAIEEELEGPVRLAAIQDLRSEQQQLPALVADRRLDDRDAVLEILLAPRPAA